MSAFILSHFFSSICFHFWGKVMITFIHRLFCLDHFDVNYFTCHFTLREVSFTLVGLGREGPSFFKYVRYMFVLSILKPGLLCLCLLDREKHSCLIRNVSYGYLFSKNNTHVECLSFLFCSNLYMYIYVFLDSGGNLYF